MARDVDIGKPVDLGTDEEYRPEDTAKLSGLKDVFEKLEEVLDSRKGAVGNRRAATIASGGTISGEIDLGGNYGYLQIEIPTIDSAALELQVSLESGGTFQDLGQDATTTAGTGAFSDTWVLGGWRYIKVKASAAQTSGAVTFQVRGVTF